MLPSSLRRHPHSHFATLVWDALDIDERTTLVGAAIKHADAACASDRRACLGVAELRDLTADQRTAIIQSVARAPFAAARAVAGLGATGLAALNEAQIAAFIQSAAADAIEGLGAEGFAALDDDLRHPLLQFAAEWSWFAARAIEGLGAEGMAAPGQNLRAAIVQTAARDPASAAAIARLGAEGMAGLVLTIGLRFSASPPSVQTLPLTPSPRRDR